MAKVFDVADYILNSFGEMTAMKLQKIVYYCQAWHLAWTEQPLFEEKIEAWRNGPVVPALFELHKGQFKLQAGFFRKKRKKDYSLSDEEKDVINRVIRYYGSRDPHWLSQLTHMESPWKTARARSVNSEDDRSSEEITHQSMFEYYSAL
jgi:uncharacterized phage-associated protein